MSDARAKAPDELFGTDGVRGVAGEEVTAEVAARVARAFATLITEGVAPTVLLARDTRESGPELAQATRDELCRSGVNVVDCGVIPTGGLCLLVRERGADGGVIVSASHNPPEFNGIKLVGAGGHKLPVEHQQQLEELLRAGAVSSLSPAAASPGRYSVDTDVAEDYLSLVGAGLPQRCLEGLHVLLDCAHGSASGLAVQAFERAGADVDAINAEGDGARINVGCGSTYPQALASTVAERGADLGVAFDGDADRAVFVDHEGEVVDGDGSKFILAADLQRRGLLDPPLVIGTVMNNFGLERALTERGIRLERTPVGDRHVAERMQETGALLGGEQSGHIIFRETLIGDGVVTALRVGEVLARSGGTLHELAAPVQKIPQHLVNIAIPDRDAWEDSHEVLEEIARWERRLEGVGRILVRPSGTEPLVRVMVEAEDPDLAREAVDSVSDVVRAACDAEDG